QEGGIAMAVYEETVDVKVPVHTAYNQWTQFEDFPMFMEGVERVAQMDDKRLHWVAEIGGQRREWDAEIVEQRPDQVIAWRSSGGPKNWGTVTFQPMEESWCRVMLRLEFEPGDMTEKVGDAMGMVKRQVQADL